MLVAVDVIALFCSVVLLIGTVVVMLWLRCCAFISCLLNGGRRSCSLMCSILWVWGVQCIFLSVFLLLCFCYLESAANLVFDLPFQWTARVVFKLGLEGGKRGERRAPQEQLCWRTAKSTAQIGGGKLSKRA